MSKRKTSLSSIELEAVAHFHIVAKALGIAGGQFGPLEVAKYDYLGGKTVRLVTSFDEVEIEGLLYFQKHDNTWIFCGVTNNQLNANGLGWRAEFRFWEDESGAIYEIEKSYFTRRRDTIEVKMKTKTTEDSGYYK